MVHDVVAKAERQLFEQTWANYTERIGAKVPAGAVESRAHRSKSFADPS